MCVHNEVFALQKGEKFLAFKSTKTKKGYGFLLRY